MQIPLLVFDEIDTNVGGEIAHAVGAKMQTLGRDHQVICITHLPQVAATASSHFVVTKDVARGRTFSNLREVTGKSRQEEIARMLGGKSESALKLAASLLKKDSHSRMSESRTNRIQRQISVNRQSYSAYLRRRPAIISSPARVAGRLCRKLR